jgi:hypothetical protein
MYLVIISTNIRTSMLNIHKTMFSFSNLPLASGVYKIIAKVITNRLKRVVDSIIPKPHNVFVRGRQILDSILIENECLDIRIMYDVLGVLCKLEIERVYDHVNWEFLLYVLRKCGVGEKWRNWIAHCISSVRFFCLGE